MYPNPFVAAVGDSMSRPVNTDQLILSAAAHTAMLAWEKDRSNKNWKRFVKECVAAKIVEF